MFTTHSHEAVLEKESVIESASVDDGQHAAMPSLLTNIQLQIVRKLKR